MPRPYLPAVFAACLGITLAAGAGNRPSILATGQFASKGPDVSGGYTLQDSAGIRTLILGMDFTSATGPDLHVLLSPQDPGEVTSATAFQDADVVAPLRALSGSQAYALPDSLNLGHYRSVLIHCVRYSHLYAAAPLSLATARLASGAGARAWRQGNPARPGRRDALARQASDPAKRFRR